MLVRAQAGGVRVPWVTADEVHGSDPDLRDWLEGQRQAFVLAVRSNEWVWISPGSRLRQLTVPTWQRRLLMGTDIA